MFPCSKKDAVKPYLDTIQVTLELPCTNAHWKIRQISNPEVEICEEDLKGNDNTGNVLPMSK